MYLSTRPNCRARFSYRPAASSSTPSACTCRWRRSTSSHRLTHSCSHDEYKNMQALSLLSLSREKMSGKGFEWKRKLCLNRPQKTILFFFLFSMAKGPGARDRTLYKERKKTEVPFFSSLRREDPVITTRTHEKVCK